jgi:His-Xaa-Ser system radical SAM maturase HxsB
MKYIELPYRYKKINNKYLVSNDHFDWLFLSENEFNLLKENKVKKGSELYKRLVGQNIIIDNREQSEKLMDRRRQQLSLLFKGPTLHIIVVTKRCDQACVYCHAAANNSENKAKYDLSMENAKKFVDIIMTSPNPFISIEIQGGEPMLNFEVVKYIFEYSQELNKKYKKEILYALVTNLQSMDDEKFEYLVKNKIALCTSLDGPKELHEKNRPTTHDFSSHDRVMEWMEKFKEKKLLVGALVTVSRESLKYPKGIVDEYLRLGYKTVHLRELNFLGKAVGTWNNISYTADEFLEFWKTAVDYIIELNKKGNLMTERRCNIILQKVLNKNELNFLDLMSPCGAIIGQVAYNYDGKIYTCDEARTMEEEIFQIGDTNTKSVPEMITNDKSIQIISSTFNDSYYCEYCPYKAYCGICPVCHYGETGSPISDVLRTSRCKILMAQFDYIFEKLQDPKTRKILESWVNHNLYKDGIIFK